MDTKKHKMLRAILGVVLVIAILTTVFFIVDSIVTKQKNYDLMVARMQAIAADPSSVTIKTSNGKGGMIDITDDFLSEHLGELENGNYDSAIDEIRENRYTFSISLNEKTREYLD